MGREQVFSVRVGARAVRVLAPLGSPEQSGDPVGVGVDARRLHLFDPDTGERLN